MHHQKKAVCPLICCCFIFQLQQYASYGAPCGPTRRVYAKEGEDFIVYLGPPPGRSVTWKLEEHILATTVPGQPIQLGEFSSVPPGKLSATKDGSLNIASLSSTEEPIYRAVLYDNSWRYLCVQLYLLRRNGRNKASPNIEPPDSCGPTRHLLYSMWGNVTLQLPDHSRVAYITWDNDYIIHTISASPNEITRPGNDLYIGRLSRMPDGSLRISRIIPQDQRIYRAELSANNQSCVQLYDLRLKYVDYSLPCGAPKTLYIEEGGDTIMQLDPSPITSVAWNFEQQIIAITRPAAPLELGEHGSGYRGRVSSSGDGSLTITGLSPEDQRIFRAILFDSRWSYICAQLFDVTMDGSNKISPEISRFESCGSTRKLPHQLGGTVRLQLPDNPQVAFIIWDMNNIDHIAITRPGGLMERQNSSYNGRLSSLMDGSLKMSNVTSKDRNIYRAELFIENWSYLCTQIFQLRQQGIRSRSENYNLQNIIRLLLSAAVLIAALSFLLHHLKTECCRGPK